MSLFAAGAAACLGMVRASRAFSAAAAIAPRYNTAALLAAGIDVGATSHTALVYFRGSW